MPQCEFCRKKLSAKSLKTAQKFGDGLVHKNCAELPPPFARNRKSRYVHLYSRNDIHTAMKFCETLLTIG